MKINIANKTSQEINFIIEAQTDKALVNALGHKFAIALSDEDEKVLEIRYYGEYTKPAEKINVGLVNTIKKGTKYYNHMNKFPA